MTIYEYIKAQESYYQTTPVPVVEGYEWNMFEHVKRTTLYLNSQYKDGNKGGTLPFKNIILPKINLEHRAVEFDLKEIEFFIDDKDQNYKSFLVKKYHDKWAPKNGINTFLDELTETYTDYGGVLVKASKKAPTVVPFQRLAFCDQTDMLSGPICEKHQYSPDQLKDMEAAHWGDSSYGATISIDELITLSRNFKAVSQADGRVTQTPGRYIEVYELHGTLQGDWLPLGDPDKYVKQMQIVAYYKKQDGNMQGVTLFRGKETDEVYKAFKRDPIYGRALGRGGVEELFEPQVWVNYSEIQRKELLDQASKVIYQTSDESFTQRNDTENMKHGTVLIHADGKAATTLNNNAVLNNAVAFDNATKAWDAQGKEIAAAYDSISGAGEDGKVPFRSSMLFNQEAHSLHQYRKGKIGGIFLDEIYRDWIVPKIVKEITKGDEFLSTLSLDEMQEIADQVITSLFNKLMIKKILGEDGKKGQVIQQGEKESLLEAYKQEFFKSGNKKFLTILENEMKDLPIASMVSITDANKNWALKNEKLAAVFTQASNILMVQPNFFNDHPEMGKLFNDILETSGLSPITYTITKPTTPTPQPQPVTQAPPMAVAPMATPQPNQPLTQ